MHLFWDFSFSETNKNFIEIPAACPFDGQLTSNKIKKRRLLMKHIIYPSIIYRKIKLAIPVKLSN